MESHTVNIGGLWGIFGHNVFDKVGEFPLLWSAVYNCINFDNSALESEQPDTSFDRDSHHNNKPLPWTVIFYLPLNPDMLFGNDGFQLKTQSEDNFHLCSCNSDLIRFVGFS